MKNLQSFTEFVNESEITESAKLNEQEDVMLKQVNSAIDGLSKRIMGTLNSNTSPQEMSDIFGSVTFAMGTLLDKYADYTRYTQSDDDDTSAKRDAAIKAIESSLKKIKKDVRGRFKK